jgi:hypothetical protein
MRGYNRNVPPGRHLGIYSRQPAPPGSQADTTSTWQQVVSHSPTIINPKAAKRRLASLKSEFVGAAVVPLLGAKLDVSETGGASEVAQFRSSDAAKKAVGLLGLEQYAPCSEKCDFRTSVLPVPSVSGAKGYKADRPCGRYRQAVRLSDRAVQRRTVRVHGGPQRQPEATPGATPVRRREETQRADERTRRSGFLSLRATGVVSFWSRELSLKGRREGGLCPTSPTNVIL